VKNVCFPYGAGIRYIPSLREFKVFYREDAMSAHRFVVLFRECLLYTTLSIALVAGCEKATSPGGASPRADAGGPYEGVVNEPITFVGSGSGDDGRIAEYAWDLGLGAWQVGTRGDSSYHYWNYGVKFFRASRTSDTSYAYVDRGNYTVSLRVTDDAGVITIDSTTVFVSDNIMSAALLR
jgi:hypothetical protein